MHFLISLHGFVSLFCVLVPNFEYFGGLPMASRRTFSSVRPIFAEKKSSPASRVPLVPRIVVKSVFLWANAAVRGSVLLR
jgi:hypothetical protein